MDENEQQAQEREPTFIDGEGREWRIDLNITLAREVKQATQVDLLKFGDAKTLQLLEDDEKFVAVLWCLLESQAQSAGVDEESFGRGLGGDSLEQALSALEVALINFSRPSRRPVMRALLERAKESTQATIAAAVETINGAKTTQAIERNAAKVSTKIEEALAKLHSGK